MLHITDSKRRYLRVLARGEERLPTGYMPVYTYMCLLAWLVPKLSMLDEWCQRDRSQVDSHRIYARSNLIAEQRLSGTPVTRESYRRNSFTCMRRLYYHMVNAERVYMLYRLAKRHFIIVN